jgi:hypothetical protein
MATAARIAIMATTIISSINVNPRLPPAVRFRCEFLSFTAPTFPLLPDKNTLVA